MAMDIKEIASFRRGGGCSIEMVHPEFIGLV
jgi:hypothetical protein